MTKFAKLFETPETQVLFIIGEDDYNDEICVNQIVELQGIRVDAKLGWPNTDEGNEKASEYFDVIDQDRAENVLTAIKKMLKID